MRALTAKQREQQFVEQGCGHCHECGHRLRRLKDSGVEWCWSCGKWRAYKSHGYMTTFYDDSDCREER